MKIVFLGPPGSGKGTYAQMLTKKGWVHFSMGQALRRHAKEGGKYAQEIDSLLLHGHLATDKIAYFVLREFLSQKSTKNVVLDGFPRNMVQAKGTGSILGRKHPISSFIFVDVPEKIIIERLKSRRQCEKCGKVYGAHNLPVRKGHCDAEGGKLILRNDDKPSVIQERFRVYWKETHPVLEWASHHYPVFYINGVGSPKVVFKRIEKVVSILK
jgi:adenylate kinase